MKKIYLIPSMEIVKMETAMMLAESTFSLFRTNDASIEQNGSGEDEYINAL